MLYHPKPINIPLILSARQRLHFQRSKDVCYNRPIFMTIVTLIICCLFLEEIMGIENKKDKTGLIKQVKSSLNKAEKAVSKHKRANTTTLVTSFTFSAIATLVAGITSAAGPVIGSGIEGWRAACIVAAILSFASTIITGISQQLKLSDRLLEGSQCVAKLRTLDIGLTIGSRSWDDVIRDYEEIVKTYPQLIS
jgi:hypothetical protein